MLAPLQRSVRAAVLLRRAQQSRLMSATVGGKPQYAPVDPKVKQLQQRYTDPSNTLPIFLRGGPSDKVLYYFTVFLCALGFGNVVKRAYERGLY